MRKTSFAEKAGIASGLILAVVLMIAILFLIAWFFTIHFLVGAITSIVLAFFFIIGVMYLMEKD